MEFIKSRIAVIACALMLAACSTVSGIATPPAPNDLPKPTVNPYLMGACATQLTDLPSGVSDNSTDIDTKLNLVLEAHGKDVVIHESCRCKVDAWQHFWCDYAGVTCPPADRTCKQLPKAVPTGTPVTVLPAPAAADTTKEKQ